MTQDPSSAVSLMDSLHEHCAAKPDSFRDTPWDHVAYKIRGKLFAIFGDAGSVTLKAHPDELEALLALPFIERAAYVGRFGWVYVRVETPEAADMARDLIDTSYELVSRRRR